MASNNSLISRTWRLFLALTRGQFFPLLILFVVGSVLNVNLEDMAAGLDPKEENTRLALHGIMGLWDLFEGLFLILLLSWGLPKAHRLQGPRYLLKPFDRPYLGSFFAEYLRVLGQVIVWGLLFIIPGFVQYVRLMFVPLIALFSADYEEGRVDALELSRRLARKVFWQILAVLIATTALEVLLELGPNWSPDLHTFPVRILAAALSLLISIWTYSFIVLLFEREMERSWN